MQVDLGKSLFVGAVIGVVGTVGIAGTVATLQSIPIKLAAMDSLIQQCSSYERPGVEIQLPHIALYCYKQEQPSATPELDKLGIYRNGIKKSHRKEM